MSLDHDVQDEVIEEKVEDEGGDVVVPGFLLNALSKIPFAPNPVPHASAWQVEEVEATLEDGSTKKLLFVVETRISGNEIRTYWYNLETLRDHVQTAMMSLQKLAMLEQAANPLVVADKTAMNNVINEAKQTGLILPGQ
jgi:hypothetical protein